MADRIAINVQIKNLPQIRKAFRKAPELMSKELRRALDYAGKAWERDTKKLIGQGYFKHPTGTLRASISNRVVGFGLNARAEISPSVYYGIYVHEGHRTRGGGWVAPRPFFVDTLERYDTEQTINDFFTKAVASVFNRIGKSV